MQYFVLAISVVEGPVPHSILFMFVLFSHSRTCDYALSMDTNICFTQCTNALDVITLFWLGHTAHHMDCNAQWIPKWPPDELILFLYFIGFLFPSLCIVSPSFLFSLYFMWHLISAVFSMLLLSSFVSLCQKRVINGNELCRKRERKVEKKTARHYCVFEWNMIRRSKNRCINREPPRKRVLRLFMIAHDLPSFNRDYRNAVVVARD